MEAVLSNLQQLITEERARIEALDSTLDAGRTPYLKNQLRHAAHLLDDANDALRMEAHAASNHKGVWIGFAGTLLQAATQLRLKVHELVDTYGGPANVVEIGG